MPVDDKQVDSRNLLSPFSQASRAPTRQDKAMSSPKLLSPAPQRRSHPTHSRETSSPLPATKTSSAPSFHEKISFFEAIDLSDVDDSDSEDEKSDPAPVTSRRRASQERRSSNPRASSQDGRKNSRAGASQDGRKNSHAGASQDGRKNSRAATSQDGRRNSQPEPSQEGRKNGNPAASKTGRSIKQRFFPRKAQTTPVQPTAAPVTKPKDRAPRPLNQRLHHSARALGNTERARFSFLEAMDLSDHSSDDPESSVEEKGQARKRGASVEYKRDGPNAVSHGASRLSFKTTTIDTIDH